MKSKKKHLDKVASFHIDSNPPVKMDTVAGFELFNMNA